MPGEEFIPVVTEENVDENITQSCDIAHGSHQSVDVRPWRALPPGKEYHMFISHSSSHRDYVLRLKSALEELGFKCMMSEHDFMPGVSNIENIERSMKECHRLLFVVTQSFLLKPFCDMEVDIAHQYAADNDRKDYMIVLRLEECKMPLKLKYITYVNGVNVQVKDVARRVGDTFESYADTCIPASQNPLANMINSENGRSILTKYPTKISLCSPSYRFKDLSEIELDTLASSSIKESVECYREMIKYANNQVLLTRYALCTAGWTCVLFNTILTVAIIALFIAVFLLVTRPIEFDEIWIWLAIPCSPWLFGLIVLVENLGLLWLSRRAAHDLFSIMSKNADCKTQHYLVLPKVNMNYIYIRFVYYNMNPCWNFLEERARERWSDASDEEIDKICRKELLKILLPICFKTTPQAEVIRHKTFKNDCCLCQLSKASWAQKPSRSSNHQGQCTESDLNEETCVLTLAENDVEFGSSTMNNEEYSKRNKKGSWLKIGSGIDNVNFDPTEDDVETNVKKMSSDGQLRNPPCPYNTCMTGAIGGTPLPESNTEKQFGYRHVSQVHGEDIIVDQQIAHETVNLDEHVENLSNIELTQSFVGLKNGANSLSDVDELCFRGEKTIDEETHAKIYVQEQ